MTGFAYPTFQVMTGAGETPLPGCEAEGGRGVSSGSKCGEGPWLAARGPEGQRRSNGALRGRREGAHRPIRSDRPSVRPSVRTVRRALPQGAAGLWGRLIYLSE